MGRKRVLNLVLLHIIVRVVTYHGLHVPIGYKPKLRIGRRSTGIYWAPYTVAYSYWPLIATSGYSSRLAHSGSVDAMVQALALCQSSLAYPTSSRF